MRTARELLDAVLNAMTQAPGTVSSLFATDGVYEAPYLESLGLPWRYRGRDEVSRFLDSHHRLFPRIEFRDLSVVADAPACVIAEYQFTARSSRTGRMTHQLIVGRLESSDGAIRLLRESVNLVELAFALYAGGLSDYRMPPDRAVSRDR